MDWTREKRCAVIGLARAGIPTARFLAERGNRVVGYDSKPFSQLAPEARALSDIGVELQLGDHHFAGLRSCHLIVLSPGLKIHHEPLRAILAEAEGRNTEVIGELELAARHCPSPMIAVTGTKGKSTTVKLLEELLRAVGLEAFRAGNTGTPLIAELPRLSPDAWAVVEVSSFQLERAPTFKPRVGVLLNLLADHQDYHPSIEQYWSTKLKLFAHQGAGDVAVLNVDDAQVREHAPQVLASLRDAGGRVLGASGIGAPTLNGEALDGAGVRDGVLGWFGAGRFEGVIALGAIPLRGSHNVANVAAAVAALVAAAGPQVLEQRDAIGNAIESFQSLPHRLELVARKHGVRWINDSQATIPDAAVAALRAFPAPVVLIAGGHNKLDDARAFEALGAALAQGAAGLVTIGQAGPDIARAAREAGMASDKVIEAGELKAAVHAAAALVRQLGGSEATREAAREATVVMSPACASFDQFSSFEERGEKFRAFVAALGE